MMTKHLFLTFLASSFFTAIVAYDVAQAGAHNTEDNSRLYSGGRQLAGVSNEASSSRIIPARSSSSSTGMRGMRSRGISRGTHSKATLSKSTAMFVFGDSISDVGNNRYGPPAFTKNAFHLPNGLDYIPGSGRFSNGKVWAEFLGEHSESMVLVGCT